MSLRQPNWTRVLTILLVILASFAILYIVLSILLHFTQVILLLVLGTIVAYVLGPLVKRLEQAFRLRWLAILFSYALVAVGLFALSVLLFTPFVQQSRSLIDNLHNPSASNLRTIARVQTDAQHLQSEIQSQQTDLNGSLSTRLSDAQIRSVNKSLSTLQRHIDDMQRGVISSGPRPARILPTRGRQPPSPGPQTGVPPSYVSAVRAPALQLQADYQQATATPSNVDLALLHRSVQDANRATAAADSMYHVMSTTPILVIRAQTWADEHNVKVDLHSKFGQAARQVGDQSANILDNAVTIVSATANVIFSITLILIISFYLLSDGSSLIRGTINIVPDAYQYQARFFVQSLDKVLGGYIRGQLLLSAMAGILAGGGAAILGVPYPLLIGLMTFLLETIPVIGPMVAVIPAVTISLFFAPLLTTVILLIWFLVFQQIVTNIIGPRVLGVAVGIHPLEALLAVLIGYPIGGLLGAFLAVPVAGILHILVREAYAYFVLGQALPTLEPESDAAASEPAPRTPAVVPRSGPGSAAR